MWFPTNKSSTAVAKIAEKDIPIIKVGVSKDANIFISDFMHSHYRLKWLTSRMRIVPLVYGAIAEGYHFFKSNMITIDAREKRIFHSHIMPCICIRAKLKNKHNYANYYCEEDLVIARGFVPKGTVYYLNAHGEGVAEQIVLTEMIKL